MPNSLKETRDKSSIQVIARAAAILRLLENTKEGMTVGQIAREVSLPRSTVQRIVAALAEEHLLISTGTIVTLGPAIRRMAQNTHFDFTSFVRPHMQVLAQKTLETVDLSILAAGQMVFVDQIEAAHRLKAVSGVGQEFSVHSSANGKAALSLMDNSSVMELYKDGIDTINTQTSHTIGDLDKLLQQLDEIRETTIAVDDQEHTEGISALGTAFADPQGRIFAISIPVPTIRFARSRDALTEHLLHFREEFIASMKLAGYFTTEELPLSVHQKEKLG